MVATTADPANVRYQMEDVALERFMKPSIALWGSCVD
jgi:hypothetical protein